MIRLTPLLAFFSLRRKSNKPFSNLPLNITTSRAGSIYFPTGARAGTFSSRKDVVRNYAMDMDAGTPIALETGRVPYALERMDGK